MENSEHMEPQKEEQKQTSPEPNTDENQAVVGAEEVLETKDIEESAEAEELTEAVKSTDAAEPIATPEAATPSETTPSAKAPETTTPPEAAEPAKAVVKEEKKEEQINFSLLSKEDLVNVLEDFINKQSFEEIKQSLEEIKKLYYEKHSKDVEEKKERFLREGGVESDFKPSEEPSEKKLNELIEKYRALKSDYNKQQEADKDKNLQTKQDILERFRVLMESQDNFNNTFKEFKALQKQWFEVGLVPQQNVKDLWNTYNFYVSKFNDYVKINRELRVLDLKKNFDLKTALCERAEELAKEKNIISAFKSLQKLHAQWREIGPVQREDKDSLWERFRAATSVINKAHQTYQSEMKGSLTKNLELKQELCEKAEAISALELSNHGQWNEKTTDLLALQEEWKTIGYAPKKDNNEIYSRFRAACDTFFGKKAAYYADSLEEQKTNLLKKEAIIQKAEQLKDSEDWKNTSEKLIQLQKQWKSVGPVPRKDSDRIWKQFRSTCDYFFNKKSEFYSGKDANFDENLKAKNEIIEELKAYEPGDERKVVLQELSHFQERFMAIGFVPVASKDKVRDDFKAAYYAALEKLGLDEQQISLIRFRNRIKSILSNPRSENKIRFERDKMMNKLQQLRSDIGVWENNIGFFKQTKAVEGTLNDFHHKIDDAKQRIEMFEKKIRIIDELDD